MLQHNSLAGRIAMRANVFWIERSGPGRLGIMPRPRGGDWLESELRSLAEVGVNAVISLLTPDEVAELELGDEERLCSDCHLRFTSFPIPDRGVPSAISAADETVALILEELSKERAVAIHCRMGIGRSALMAACLLISEGVDVDTALASIGRARGFPVPDTEEQTAWLRLFEGKRKGGGNH
jgi:protein-tyrosine phosphatase